jgi:hypothetical protein
VVVMTRNGRTVSYRHRYNLEVESFNVQDENKDGIYEPGEFISVTDIRIRNTGKNNTIAMLLD